MNVLVRNLNQFQNEDITIPTICSTIYYVISAICAGNLAANEVEGFQRNSKSENICRHCYIAYERRRIPLTDISYVPRTRLKHGTIVNNLMINNENNSLSRTEESWKQ